MLNITARTRVSELQQGPPGIMRALVATGIFREGDDPEVMLGELCWSYGFNPGILIMILESANRPEEVPPIDVAPFEAMPLLQLVDHIEQVHHGYLREHLPRLTALTAAVAAARPEDERLKELDEEMQRLAVELDGHLNHEEEALFPMVRDMETRGTVTPTRCGSVVSGPIACMETEHEETGKTLVKMRELTDNYAQPQDGFPAWGEMVEALARFDRDLVEHMYKENKVLFPRALDAQGEKRAARAC